MPNFLLYLIIILGVVILIWVIELMLGNRKTRFLEAFFGLGLAAFWSARTFLVPSFWNIILSAFLIIIGIKWLLMQKIKKQVGEKRRNKNLPLFLFS